MVQAGAATVDGALATETDRVFRGQRIHIRLIEPPDKLLAPESIDIPVIYRDPWMMVVNKPAGITAHPTGLIQRGTLANAIQAKLDNLTDVRGILRPGIVHRLDRQTSGLMVIALTHQAHSELAAAFEASRVSKKYVALVEGVIEQQSGVLDWPIGRAPTGRHTLMSCLADARNRKPSKTKYLVLKRYRDHTLVLAHPQTGRNHQIRVHLAHLGYPLVGDEFYDVRGRLKPFDPTVDPEISREYETGFPIKRHALHAAQLELAHPITGVWMRFTAEPPLDFQETMLEMQRTL